MISQHEKWMRLALSLAERGKYAVSPNPMVGALVVRNGRILGRGYHSYYGGDHAEVIALRQAGGSQSKGATLYVTLEPCSSWGKTPPCVSSIIEAGIRNVVIGAIDPNPRNHEKGLAALKRAGIKVQKGILAAEVLKQNAAFFKYITQQMPFVTLKMAQSLDGKIATRSGSSRWISSPASRDFVHRLRAEQDALLVGKNTLMLDNPRLSPLIKIKDVPPEKPWRVVLDPELQVSPKARVFEGSQLTLLAVSERKISKIKKNNGPRSAILVPVPEKKGKLDVRYLLRRLAEFGIAKLLVEGGGELAWSLIQENLVDKAYWIVAPKIIGGRTAKTSVEGDGIEDLEKAYACKIQNVSKLGEDYLFETYF